MFVPLAVARASRTFPLFRRTLLVAPPWPVVTRPGHVIGRWAQVGADPGFVPDPVVRHATGAGIRLPLVVGMSLRMLPGFAALRPDPEGTGASWLVSGFAVNAGLSRIGPGLVSWIMGRQ